MRARNRNAGRNRFILGVAIAGLLTINEATRVSGVSLLALLGVFGLIVLALRYSRQLFKSSHLAQAERICSALVEEHLETLATRRDTLVRVDRYGVVDGSEWVKEVDYFAKNVLVPKLSYKQANALADAGYSATMTKWVEGPVREYSQTRNRPQAITSDTSPLDFEGMCAAILRNEGWSASTTKGSGDQGADVIATCDGMTLVLQCKLYTGAVGNKAVQEVIAARHFYSAELAAVVVSSSFTKSARQLAQASNVDIITYEELPAYSRQWREGLSGGAQLETSYA